MNIQEKTKLKIKEWEKRYGGLSIQIEQQINRLLAEYESKKQITNNVLNLGVVIVKEYQGQTYTITATEKGFQYNNKHYRSLSAIANEITGTHCNGKRFFGVANG